MLMGSFGTSRETVADEAYRIAVQALHLSQRADSVGLKELSYILIMAAQEAEDRADVTAIRQGSDARLADELN